MEPEGSLPCSQGTPTSPYPEKDEPVNTFRELLPYDVFSYCLHIYTLLSPSALHFCFTNQNIYAFLISHMCVIDPNQLIFLDLITLITFGEAYRL